VQVDNVTFRFEINEQHHAVNAVRDQVGPHAAQLLSDLIGALENSIPYNAIYSALAADQRPEMHSELSEGELRLAHELIAYYLKKGETPSTAIQLVMQREPFFKYPQLANKLGTETEP
jgi:hypothetical protein